MSCYLTIGLTYPKKVNEKLISFFSMRDFRMPLDSILGLCFMFHGFYFTYPRTGKPHETRGEHRYFICMGSPYFRSGTKSIQYLVFFNDLYFNGRISTCCACSHRPAISLCHNLVAQANTKYGKIKLQNKRAAISRARKCGTAAEYQSVRFFFKYIIYGRSIFHQLYFLVKIAYGTMYQVAGLAIVIDNDDFHHFA